MSLQGTSTLITSMAGGREQALTEQGGSYSAISPTPGTGLLLGVVNTFVETTPALVVYNGGLLNVFPHYLRMHTTVISTTAGAASFWTNPLDMGHRYSSGGTALTVSNTNMNSANPSGVIATFGAVTASAATTARRVISNAPVKFVVVDTVHDTITLNWGSAEASPQSALINNAASLAPTSVNHGPCMIGPGQSMVLVHWIASQTVASTLEVEFGFVAK